MSNTNQVCGSDSSNYNDAFAISLSLSLAAAAMWRIHTMRTVIVKHPDNVLHALVLA